MSDPTIRHRDVVDAASTQPVTEPPVTDVVRPAVVEQPVLAVDPGDRRRVATRSRRRWAPDSIITGLVGLALLVVGLIAVARAKLDGPMNQPVVDVLGFAHTATLGMIEAAFGLCLLICAAATSRAGAIFFGLALAVAGVVGAAQTSTFEDSLALESSWVWILAAAGAVVVLASLLLPRTMVESSRVEST